MSRQANTPGWWGHGDLAASFVLIFPVLLAYEVGVLFVGRVNGADVVTRLLFTLLGSKALYLLVHAIVAVLFLLWIRRHDRWGTLRLEVAAPVVLEAAIYALTLGAVVTLVLQKAFGLAIGALPRGAVVSALGAGVHEEIVFRLGLFAGLTSLLEHRQQRFAMPVALVVSSIVFAAAHHVGAHGEAFTTHAFMFRALAGAAFASIFWYRSLAHAVYAHTLYDLVVLATS